MNHGGSSSDKRDSPHRHTAEIGTIAEGRNHREDEEAYFGMVPDDGGKPYPIFVVSQGGHAEVEGGARLRARPHQILNRST